MSEVAFCLYSGSKRFVSLTDDANSSFDTFNTETSRAEQIKACSVKSDLTSFGPNSKWDDIYFLDFYNQGKFRRWYEHELQKEENKNDELTADLLVINQQMIAYTNELKKLVKFD